MNAKRKIMLVAALSATSAGVFSCERQDPAAELAVAATPQPSTSADLATTMAADPVVRSFVLANERFLNEDEAYYNGLTEAGKAARRADLQAHFENGTECPDPYRTPAQLNAHYASQEALTAQIRATYPQLYQLSEEEQLVVKDRAAQLIRENAATATAHSAPGHAGYVASMWDNSGPDAAKVFRAGRAFYNGYMGYLQ
ncbi:hypothetical protein [Hymenobacter ruricola]|uniref:Uncharacterized protein n=1 Tax=Hymenobacter ruricola TaxID=2791023 RepID=A0ABS0HZG7_9BACT|nr:hypothetical protein [Hymenobacter ruricola]MBF9220095.1 hypothetical protein [Hymenobacter ruricola]